MLPTEAHPISSAGFNLSYERSGGLAEFDWFCLLLLSSGAETRLALGTETVIPESFQLKGKAACPFNVTVLVRGDVPNYKPSISIW